MFSKQCSANRVHNGHSRSSNLVDFAPTESAQVTSYWTSTVTLILSCRVSDIRRKPLFGYPSAILAKVSGCSLSSRSMMFGSAESENPGYLTVELFARNSNVCHHNPPALQTTNGRTTYHRNTTRC